MRLAAAVREWARRRASPSFSNRFRVLQVTSKDPFTFTLIIRSSAHGVQHVSLPFNPLLRVHTLYRSMSVMLLEVTVFRPPCTCRSASLLWVQHGYARVSAQSAAEAQQTDGASHSQQQHSQQQ
jgi:hypothetical protein